jgi:hypothetical protein
MNEEIYEPTEAQTEVINRVWRRFEKMREERDRPKKYFDGRDLATYINDSANAWNGVIPEEIKASKDDWQSLVFDHITRGKVKALVALVVGSQPYINIIGATRRDNRYAWEMNKLFEHEWRERDERMKNYYQALDCAIKGTVVVEEFYREEKKKTKEIKSVNHDTGEIKYKEKTEIKGGRGHVDAEIVPLENFYPNEHQADVKSDCIRMSYMSVDEFQKKFGSYPDADKVKRGLRADYLDNIDYKRIAHNREDIVEVLKYYNEDDDELIILANGVWINPQEGDKVSPLPYDHKRLPFVKTVFEPADVNEFYGKSLPDLMTGEQETINALLRMMIDKEVLVLNRPLLMGMGAELEAGLIEPNAQLSVSEDLSQVRELDIRDIGQSPFSLVEFLVKRSNTNTAIDPMAQGVHTGRKTASEAQMLDQNSKQMASSFQLFIFHLLKKRAELRVQNICQFYRKPIQYGALVDQNGNYEYTSSGNIKRAPQYRTVVEDQPGGEPTYLEISPEILKANYLIRFEEDFFQSKGEQNREMNAQKLLIESKSNPLLDADECTIDWLMAIGKDPKRFYMGQGSEGEVPQALSEMNDQSIGEPPVPTA